MSAKEEIHELLLACCDQVLTYIQEREPLHADRWVPATEVNEGLAINFSSVPKGSTQPSGNKGWLFATLARMLEEQERLEYQNVRGRSYYRSVRK